MARNSLKNVIRLIDVANTTLQPEQSFLADLKRSIEISEDKHTRKPSKTYKPSSMQCIRNMYYQVTGQEPDVSHSSYIGVGICNSGSDIHIRIQTAVEQMKENGIDCEFVSVADFVKQRNLDYLDVVANTKTETKLYHKTLNMSFMCDGIIKYNGHYYILELKTENSNKFWQRNNVDPKHHNQAIAYSVAFGIDEVIFVYISRDTLDMKSYMYQVTNDMKQELVGRIDLCDKYAEQLKVPPKPFDIPKSVCQYCNYAQSCRKAN